MVRRTLLLASALFAGVVTSQAPEFAQQYRQRLGGAVDELARIVGDFDRDAAKVGLDRSRAIASLSSNSDELVRLRGANIAYTASRYERLRAQQQALEQSGALGRIQTVMFNPDGELASATWDAYEPAVPTTAAGAATAAIGFFAVYLLAGCAHVAAYPLRRRQRLRERQQPMREA